MVATMARHTPHLPRAPDSAAAPVPTRGAAPSANAIRETRIPTSHRLKMVATMARHTPHLASATDPPSRVSIAAIRSSSMSFPIQSVAVFCGARVGADPAHAEAARELGAAIAEAGMTLIYGGGGVGLMGEVARAAAGGRRGGGGGGAGWT